MNFDRAERERGDARALDERVGADQEVLLHLLVTAQFSGS
jgi:hypothetical protein